MNQPRCYFTTSWDDGHPCDLRLAEILSRHEIPATFYVPAASQRQCVNAAQVRLLGQRFEVGAHTVRHLPLTGLSDADAVHEIADSKQYLEDILGRSCRSFAPPSGRFGVRHLQTAAVAGFRCFRTTELMSLDLPRRKAGIAVMPTTLQLFGHPRLAYWKNALRRFQSRNLFLYERCGRGRDLVATFESLLKYLLKRGGAFHLWGHGWEIDDCGNWDVLSAMLERIAAYKSQLRLVSNSALCDEAVAHECSADSTSCTVLPG